jgi:polyisoprenoid-binding protein YceI
VGAVAADITGTFQLGPDTGRVLIKTGRAGLAARAGHDLTIEVTRWSARASVPADGGVGAAEITAELDLGSLAVRAGTGGAKPLTDKDRRDILNQARKILGGGTATFASTRVIPANPGAGGAVEGTVSLNGRSQPVRLQVTGSGPYRGGATVKQTDFGITPYSGFFGALKLRDEVGIEFEVDLERAARS